MSMRQKPRSVGKKSMDGQVESEWVYWHIRNFPEMGC